jgi:uncharacterized membrane protein
MGILAKLMKILHNEEAVEKVDTCIRETQRLIKEQVEMRDRLDKVSATLDGEEDWFITFHRKKGVP